MNGSLKNGSTNGSHRNGSSKNGSATHHEEKLLLSRKRVAEAIAEQPWPKKPRILEKTDVSRWRLNDEDGRHRWVYVEDNQALKDWPQSYAEKYYLGLPLGLPDLPPPESPLDAATNGLTFFEKLQLDPGEWGCECGGPMFLLPGIVITWYVTKTPISTFHATEIKNYLFARADPELGGWGLHIEGESTAFGCTLSYTALRLLGVDAEDPIMVKARARLHQLGGATSSPHWAKWWLAVLGVASWDLVNPVPPELWLVPDWEIKVFCDRAVKWITSNQTAEGGWYGSWGICFTYAAMFALESLAGVGDVYETSAPSRKGCDFLVGKQRFDGGWSESYKACETMKWVEHQSGSLVVQTAWAALALMEAKYPDVGPIKRAIRFIMSRQQSNGEWLAESIECVFNKSCMITYPNYKSIFPIKALGLFAKKYPDEVINLEEED
ncbi:hypothetical protein BN1708_016715 [Verticillium longisporum]|uniref:Squalene cyclase N-terminal domain-containing protein n=1 Tax=Verticillium longisporum TaxID=100787 RepID=A0A0G4MXL4_VERLO|nr:hypothetical protein BN1708_016715 [Verticillium longisporum]